VIEDVTAKFAKAELIPSLAKTCLMPAVSLEEKIKAAENEPLASAAIEEGFVTVGFPSKFMFIFELSTKFEPVTVTAVPIGPLVGLTAMLGVVTRKVVFA
jgi:hypothetical protein